MEVYRGLARKQELGIFEHPMLSQHTLIRRKRYGTMGVVSLLASLLIVRRRGGRNSDGGRGLHCIARTATYEVSTIGVGFVQDEVGGAG